MIKRIFGYRFVSATFLMYFATLSLSVGNYLYHLLMGRLLGPSQYGVLESVISFLYILSIPLMTLSLVVVKFSSSYKGTGNLKAISVLYYYIQRQLLLYGFLSSIILLVISPFVAQFLYLPSQMFIFLLAGAFFIGTFNMMSKGFLQGLTNFFGLAISNLSETVIKLAVALFLVFAGLKAAGAFTAILIAMLVGYFVARRFLQKIITVKGIFKDKQKLFTFSLPVFLNNLAFTSLFTSDILLVRHFFPGAESGYYAALSVLGKILFFGASPVALVMFPLVSEHHASQKKYSHFLFLSLLFSIGIVVALTIFYFSAPNLVVHLLFGKSYQVITPLLGYFAIFISLYTLASLFSNFYLSIHRTGIIFLAVAAALSQILLLLFFHTSLFEMIKVSIVVTFLLLLGLLLYYPYAKNS